LVVMRKITPDLSKLNSGSEADALYDFLSLRP